MRTLAHIVNPVQAGPESNLSVAQPITFATMQRARQMARDIVDVQFLSAHFPEDEAAVPADFHKTPPLERSVLDIRSFHRARKLPLLADICDRLYASAPDADYLIYTNVDIALMPQFYWAIAALLDQGYDGLVINRRDISKTYRAVADLPLMYGELGHPQGGHDCFIFRRDAYPRYDLGLACIGAPRVGKVMLLNVIYHAQRFGEFNDAHLTFHWGRDRVWKHPALEDYVHHNDGELRRIFNAYQAQGPLPDHPQIQKLCDRYLTPDSALPLNQQGSQQKFHSPDQQCRKSLPIVIPPAI